MESHLREMKEITDKLASIGAKVAEEDEVVTLLGSLPSSYSGLVPALEARENVTLDYVQQSLIQEEMKRKSANADGAVHTEGDSALVGASRKEYHWKPPICWKCNESGHIQCFCPREKDARHEHGAKAVKEISSLGGSTQDSNSDNDLGVFVAGSNMQQNGKWLIDSGASSHMTSELQYLSNYRPFEVPETVGLGDGRTVEALGFGNVSLRMLFSVSGPKPAVLHDVLYVPKLSCNLFSVRAATSKGNIVQFDKSKCWIRRKSGRLDGMGSLVGKLYQLDCESVPGSKEQASQACVIDGVDLWHQRLGHPSESRLNDIVRKELVAGVKLPKASKVSFCQGCVEGKMSRKPFKTRSSESGRSTRKLEIVHSDVCGPMSSESLGGRRYFVTFIDDFSRCCKVYFLKHKSEVFQKFKEFEAKVTNQSGNRIGTLRTDNGGGEYLSNEFQDYLASKGITHELTMPHTPQQNGVAERMNRTLQESARAMLAHANLPQGYWAEAIAAAAYLRNRVAISPVEQKTPHEMWYGRRPNLSHLHVFGCIAYAQVPDCERKKFDGKARKLCFVGYCTTSKDYRLFDEETLKLIKSRDVNFNETVFELTSERPKETATVEPTDRDSSAKSSDESSDVQQPVTEPRRSQRERRPLIKYGIDEFVDAAAEIEHQAFNVTLIDEPNTLEGALSSEQSVQWEQAAESESLMENQTWELEEDIYMRNPTAHARTKHINIRYREAVQEGPIELQYHHYQRSRFKGFMRRLDWSYSNVPTSGSV